MDKNQFERLDYMIRVARENKLHADVKQFERMMNHLKKHKTLDDLMYDLLEQYEANYMSTLGMIYPAHIHTDRPQKPNIEQPKQPSKVDYDELVRIQNQSATSIKVTSKHPIEHVSAIEYAIVSCGFATVLHIMEEYCENRVKGLEQQMQKCLREKTFVKNMEDHKKLMKLREAWQNACDELDQLRTRVQFEGLRR